MLAKDSMRRSEFVDIKTVFELCKKNFGRDIKYVRRLSDGNYEAHEVKQNTMSRLIFEIKDGKIKILFEIEEEL